MCRFDVSFEMFDQFETKAFGNAEFVTDKSSIH